MRATFPVVMIAILTILPATGDAKDSAPPLLIPAENFDPSVLLAPPPTPGSRIGKWELEGLHRIEATRTPAEFARAKHDDETKDVSIFADAMGPGFDMTKLPATKALIDLVRAEEQAAAGRAKEHFRRSRPWIVDPSLRVCSSDDGPQSSYPSGHTTMGYAMAEILARLAPRKAPAILARAADYAENRLVCGMHFPTDIAAGEELGTVVAERLMQQPAFLQRMALAQAELANAGLN